MSCPVEVPNKLLMIKAKHAQMLPMNLLGCHPRLIKETAAGQKDSQRYKQDYEQTCLKAIFHHLFSAASYYRGERKCLSILTHYIVL
jgi:hypothetical protein